jgi:23S rRNA (guanosine2251-2'-O)-methyltransferase
MSSNSYTKSRKDSHFARLRRAHRDHTAIRAPQSAEASRVYLYGLHTVRAALDNPARRIHRLWVTRNAAERAGLGSLAALPFPAELVEPRTLDRIVGADAVHQGIVLETDPLAARPLDALGPTDLVVVLDQVTDPHNVGAVMRSAVAFGAGALLTTTRHSATESGVLAKAASGALEHLDLIAVRNLAEALASLKAAGFLTIGLDSEAADELEACLAGSRIALVLGAEGRGLRQKTRATVDRLARLALPGTIRSLNVSNAAAVALYAARRHLG